MVVLTVFGNNMPSKSTVYRLYRTPGFTKAKKIEIFNKLKQKCELLEKLDTEICFHVEITSPITERQKEILKWVLQDALNPQNLFERSQLKEAKLSILIEVGPRFNFSTSNSTNAVSICQSLGLNQVTRLEISRSYLLSFKKEVSKQVETDLASLLYDRMTECRYTPENIPKSSFNEKLVKKEDIREIDVLGKGIVALKEIDDEMGLAFDDADLTYYTNLFKTVLKRNPTNVECFDLAQSNSEHSRHWFFKGKMVIDGVEHEDSLIDMIIDTQKHTNPNNVIKFSDNSR